MARQFTPNPLRKLTIWATIVLGLLTTGWMISTTSRPPRITPTPAPKLERKTQAPIAETATYRIGEQALTVFAKPDRKSSILGWIEPSEPFDVFELVSGTGCDTPGWARTEGHGFVCLENTRATEEMSMRLPRLVRFVHPDPKEWDRYVSTMTYDTSPADRIDALVPFIYAKRWRKWRGPNYASVDAYIDGDPPIRSLGSGRKYHFIDAIETPKGTVLLRDNGAVVPYEQVHVYPLTKFHGRDVTQHPIPSGFIPAWAINYDGTSVYTQPRHDAPVGRQLEYHTAILVEDAAVDSSGEWWRLPDGLGKGVPGYVSDQTGIRHWQPSPRPEGIMEGALWIDVDLAQQVLALMRGDTLEFVTLVSTGEPGTSTPRGLFRIYDKSVWADMASRPASDDPYYVEKVPWAMHFKKRYAIHGTFWHWGFGHTASHGCINLSVRDARYVFDRVSPTTYGGWHTALASTRDPGTTLRIRRGQGTVRDRRSR